MPTAEGAAVAGAAPAAERAGTGTASHARLIAWGALAFVLAGGLALRLWGYRQGLPFVYNIDEADHFVPHAVAMFQNGTLNPHYFANPPAFTYLLHFVFALAYGGGSGVLARYRHDPASVYELARVTAAVLGTLSLWLLYLTGARLLGRAAGLLAAAVEAVAFLPSFYAHLALNDVPTLAPLSASLLGTAGVLRKGRLRDYLLAGAGLGLACATKYTAGIVLLPLLAAAAVRLFERGHTPDAARRVLAGLAVAGVAALLAFLIANPYAALDYHAFHAELVHQSSLSAEAQGKLGAPHESGVRYYLWSFTWGLGWAPALAAVVGMVVVWWREPRLGWVLVPAPLLFLVFMGLQGRYFGRWLLPVFPIVCLLAALAVVWAVDGLAGRRRPWRWAFAALLCAGLIAQGLIHTIHSGMTLARADTRTATRRWMLANIPRGALLVAEPVSPVDWARELTGAHPESLRWRKYPSLVSRITPAGSLTPHTRVVTIESYETTLAPALLGYYRANGYCWVITGSTQSGRAFANPRAAPRAIAYYRALERSGEVVFRASPYAVGKRGVPFNFDWSFDYYPLAYARGGPLMTVYRLHGGRCGAR
jgi:hypothetical protein